MNAVPLKKVYKYTFDNNTTVDIDTTTGNIITKSFPLNEFVPEPFDDQYLINVLKDVLKNRSRAWVEAHLDQVENEVAMEALQT